MPVHNTHARDAALRQLSRINRWLIAGSITLTGVLTDVAAHAFPGRTTATTGAKARGSGAHAKQPSASHAATPATTTSTEALHPPAQAPQASSEPTHSQESAPAHESAPAPESAPAQEPAPAPEQAQESAPVVSGGS